MIRAEQAMRLALREARRASGRVFPNPPVGAVVFRGDRVLGRGFTHPPGGPHAEVVALRAAERRRGLRGASLAVTLEPCAHQGRTGPCAPLVAASGVRRVFVGHRDPQPAVSGRGLRRLRRAGIEVTVGVLETDCRGQHRGYLSVLERGRPWVRLKLASTLDGRIATASGESRWITGPAARAAVHRLRARADAVMVGSQTVLRDDPELTARRGGAADGRVLHRPVRVVVDSRLRVPVSARLYRRETGRSWVLCGKRAPARRRQALVAAGVRLVEVNERGPALDLRRSLGALARAGLTEVLVEGGGRLAAALLRDDLVDEVDWFVAPRLLGGDGRPALGPLAHRALSQATRLLDPSVRRVGDDLHIHGLLRRRESP